MAQMGMGRASSPRSGGVQTRGKSCWKGGGKNKDTWRGKGENQKGSYFGQGENQKGSYSNKGLDNRGGKTATPMPAGLRGVSHATTQASPFATALAGPMQGCTSRRTLRSRETRVLLARLLRQSCFHRA